MPSIMTNIISVDAHIGYKCIEIVMLCFEGIHPVLVNFQRKCKICTCPRGGCYVNAGMTV